MKAFWKPQIGPKIQVGTDCHKFLYHSHQRQYYVILYYCYHACNLHFELL